MNLPYKSFQITGREFQSFIFINLIFIGSFFIFLSSSYVSRWGPFLTLGVTGFVIFPLWKKFNNRTIEILILLAYLLISIYLDINIYLKISSYGITLIALILLIFPALHSEWKDRPSKFIIIFISIFYITNLFNYNNFISITEQPLFNFIIITVAIKLISVFNANLPSKKNNLFLIPGYLLFALLSFRSDPLFSVNGSEYHWAYYANVIATYQSGGILLWDTPSQYGFLNIILGSLLSKDPWQSFYLLQSFLLFLVTSLSFSTLNSFYGDRKFGTLICFLATMIFFFADPALIGPQPFPSSSVLRFSPSYLLLISILYMHGHKKISNKYGNILISAFFTIGCLWSAESLIYCFAIFFSYSFSRIVVLFKGEKDFDFKEIIFDTIFPVILLSATCALVIIFYISNYGVKPDFRMFFMYGKYYSDGFGSLPLTISGFIWALLLPLAILIAIFTYLYKSTNLNSEFISIFTITGAIFAWFSYFIGRAVPNNIMVLAPMLIWCYLIVISLLHGKVNTPLYITFKFCAYIYIVVHISSYLIQPQFFSLFSLSNFKTFNKDISKNRAEAHPELQSLIKKNNLSNKDFVYYGYSGTFPANDSNEINKGTNLWLPQPFALLDEPIPSAISDRITERFVARNKREGYIVLDVKNHNQKYFLDWLNRLSKYYDCSINSQNLDYQIYACTLTKKS